MKIKYKILKKKRFVIKKNIYIKYRVEYENSRKLI